MMSNLIKFFTAAALFVLPCTMFAQVSTSSLNPEEDQIAFEDMRARMDAIRVSEHRPTVALVLSGGGAKGASHVGALKYIEELKIPVDMILGTSMGGLVGGLYSLGYNAEYLDSLLTSVDWNFVLSDKVPREYISYATRKYRDKYALAIPFHYSRDVFMAMTGQSDQEDSKAHKHGGESEMDIPMNNIARSLPAGYISGLNVNNIFSSLSAGYQDSISFRDLPIPFCCVASDMVSCQAKNWTAGSIKQALRSTMSIPGLFDPVRTGGMVLVDGGTRNNFPTDLAREMGADYVIGVELSDPNLTYDEINNIADILWKFIDMLGREAFSKNVGMADVFIKPDLHEYNMLSFDSESISIIIDRGYEAAKSQSEALKALKELMPDAEMRYHNVPADDINRNKVQIGSVEFSGLKDSESRFLAGKLGLRAGDYVGKADVEHAVSVIFATGSFESVTYELLGSQQPYRLVFDCAKRPVHQFGIGYRADNETLVDVILNVGFNAHKIAGTKFELTGKLGQGKYAEGHFSFDLPRTPTINLTAKIGGHTADLTYGDVYRLKYWYHKEEAYLSNMHWTRFDLNVGARNEYFCTMDWLSNGEVAMSDEVLNQSGGNFLSVFASARANTFDESYYPSRGLNLGLDYKWLFAKPGDKDFHPEHIASMDFRKVFRMGGHVAFIIGLNGRAVVNFDKENGYSDFPMKNFIGGYMAGRYVDHQIPFVGFGDMMCVNDFLASADASLRFRFGRNFFTTFQGGYFKSVDNLSDFTKFEDGVGFSALGAGLEVGYRTIIGPIKINFHWSDMTEKVGAYLSFGYDF